MAKVLVTGGAGFIGYYIVKRLSEDNHTVFVIDNLKRGRIDNEFQKLSQKENVYFINADLTDQATFESIDKDFDYIYHLAAVIGVKNVIKDPDKVLYVNAITTLNLFEHFKKSNSLRKIFFSSTSEVYAGTLRHFNINIPTDETVPLAIDDIYSNRTTYAISKIYGESVSLVYGKKYNLPVTIGRYHNIYGPRMGYAHVIPETFIKISKAEIIDVPSPYHTRSFCYIDDAVEFTIAACENTKTVGEILHIGNSKEEIKIKDLILKIAEVMEKDIKINELPDASGSPARRCPDTTKVEKLTGYTPSFSLEEGIRRTYEWYRNKLDISYEQMVTLDES